MKCPHCLQSFHDEFTRTKIIEFDATQHYALHQLCPACKRPIIFLYTYLHGTKIGSRLIEPKSISRSPIPGEVPDIFAEDYRQACLILSDSPKASAALSRRCLQNILREKAKVKKQDLSKEIDEVLASGKIPSHLAEGIDAIRNIGNFAAHPMKSTNTGEILDVEPGEAEWTLDILEGLFDFYFVQPAMLQQKRDALNKKLQEAGKPPLK
jgi:hypothetical protein